MMPPFLRRRRRRPEPGDLVEILGPEPRLAICRDVKRRSVLLRTAGGSHFWAPAQAVVPVETTMAPVDDRAGA